MAKSKAKKKAPPKPVDYVGLKSTHPKADQLPLNTLLALSKHGQFGKEDSEKTK